MKDEPRVPVRHQLDHAVPTVIHNPDEDMPLLARWLRRAMENQTRFWSLIAGLVAVVVVLAILANGLSLGTAASDEAWTKIDKVRKPAERVEIAKEFPNTPASRWALLDAANGFYEEGFRDLPANRETAGPNLKRAFDLFEQVEREASEDSPQARAAAFGAARTLEARNQLDKAIEKYKQVAKKWPGTEEAKRSEALAKELEKPESVAFYKELYEYKAPEMTLPALGKGGLNLPANHPPLDGLIPPITLPPPPSPVSKPEADKSAAPAEPALPADVFAPSSKKETAPKK